MTLDFCWVKRDDFGQTLEGSPAYLSPELFEKYLYGKNDVIYDNKVDIFSLGAIFWEMLFGSHFLWVKGEQTVDAKNLFERIKKNTGRNIWKNEQFEQKQKISKGVQYILEKMTEFDPKDRIDWVTLFNENFWKYVLNSECENFLENDSFWESIDSEEFTTLHRNILKNNFFFS